MGCAKKKMAKGGMVKRRKALIPGYAAGGFAVSDDPFFAPDPNMYRNDAKNMANVQAYIKEQGGTIPGPKIMAFGPWWYLHIGRTIFLALLLAWLWRLVLLSLLFKWIAALELSLVPTHPDRCAGLGFMARAPTMFVPVVLGISSVFASGWAHQVVYHDVAFASLRVEIIAFVLILPLLCVTPFFSFLGLMLRTKKQGLLDYGDLIGGHDRLVRERWIEGKPITNAPILDAPELGPIADTAAAYELTIAMAFLWQSDLICLGWDNASRVGGTASITL